MHTLICTILVCTMPASDPTEDIWRIEQSGIYTLAEDRVSTGKFNIMIDVSDVELDLNGKTIRCMPDDPKTAVTFGIYAPEIKNLKIRNGKITGCFSGLHAVNSSNMTIEDVDFTGNTSFGASLGGENNVVRRCIFASIRGYTGEPYNIGLNNPGSNSLVESNVFRQLYRELKTAPGVVGEGVGVLLAADASNTKVRDNLFENEIDSQDIAIWIGQDSNALIERNTIIGFARGIAAVGSPAKVIATENRLTLRKPLPGSIGIGRGVDVRQGNVIVGFETAVEGDASDRR